MISNNAGDLLSQFVNINEKDIPVLERLADLPPQFKSTPHQKMLINKHTDANKGKIEGYLYLEDLTLGFHLLFKTANLQDNIYTTMADDTVVTVNSFYLYIPILIPSVETQIMFIEATQNNYKISYDEYYKERQVVSDMIIQHDIGSAQKINSPKNLIRAHQSRIRSDTPNKNIRIAIFDNLDFRKSFVEIDGQRYPRDSSLMILRKRLYINIKI